MPHLAALFGVLTDGGHHAGPDVEHVVLERGVNTIKSAYEKQGFAVRVDVCSDHFARLRVTIGAMGDDDA